MKYGVFMYFRGIVQPNLAGTDSQTEGGHYLVFGDETTPIAKPTGDIDNGSLLKVKTYARQIVGVGFLSVLALVLAIVAIITNGGVGGTSGTTVAAVDGSASASATLPVGDLLVSLAELESRLEVFERATNSSCNCAELSVQVNEHAAMLAVLMATTTSTTTPSTTTTSTITMSTTTTATTATTTTATTILDHITATGGEVTIDGTFKVHTFTETGTFTIDSTLSRGD
eukprot:gene18317-16764_t